MLPSCCAICCACCDNCPCCWLFCCISLGDGDSHARAAGSVDLAAVAPTTSDVLDLTSPASLLASPNQVRSADPQVRFGVLPSQFKVLSKCGLLFRICISIFGSSRLTFRRSSSASCSEGIASVGWTAFSYRLPHAFQLSHPPSSIKISAVTADSPCIAMLTHLQVLRLIPQFGLFICGLFNGTSIFFGNRRRFRVNMIRCFPNNLLLRADYL